MQSSKTSEVTGKKLFEDFNVAFSQSDVINEVCVISTKKESDSSPINIYENCIGIEKWCLKRMFVYAYKSLVEKIGFTSIQNWVNLDLLLRCSLLFCPDCSTLWNFKKRLLAIFKPTNDQSVYDKYLQDLHLTELSLKLHPKSGGAFAHRKWLLSSFFLVQPVSIRQAHVNSFVCSNCKAAKANPVDDRKCFSQKDWNFLINELDFCTRVASWHSCNYMAWSHRVWVISNYVVSCLNGDYIAENDSVQLIQLIQLMFNDKNAVEKWMESHVSDHSCMSYVHFIFVQLNRIELRKCRGCGVGLIQNCFSVSLFSLYTSSLCSNNEILLLHEGQHEALWSHRRALFVLYHKYFNKIRQSVGCDQSIFSMDSELNFCKHFVSSDQFVQRCISRHVKYLKTWVFQ